MELAGKRLGHLRVLELIGEGGMGRVYAAHDETLDRRVALKVLHVSDRSDRESRARMLREARMLSKIDHPNICRIHDFMQEDSLELLVLEYIDGRTLEELRRGMSYSQKLSVASVIAGVLVSAHRTGVIHRDLKPENVMITADGTAKVLDFGLARLLQGPAADPPATAINDEDENAERTAVFAGVTPRHSGLLTRAGVTVGTPLFMSPEQARGEALTPASDMYSFGLVLQTLFADVAPHPDDLTSFEVLLRAAGNQTEPATGAPTPIRALIERLKQTAPTDRPTAVETAARLQWIAARPKRIVRWTAAAAVAFLVAGGAWRYTADLAEERTNAVQARTIAVAARQEAEHRRHQAEDLIDFMVGDLHKSLQQIGKLEILDKAAARAMTYMSSQRPEMMTAGELTHNATALHNLGQVRLGQGKLPDALQAFEQSLKLSRHAITREPANLPVRFTLGQSQFWVGEANRLLGNHDEALAKMREYLATSEMLARAAPANRDYQIELAYGYSNLGTMLEGAGDLTGALAHYRRCAAIKENRLRTDPSNRQWQGELALTINKIAYVLQKQGDLLAARRCFDEEKQIYARLVSRQPDHAPWRHRLVSSHAYLGALLVDLGELDAAAVELEAACENAGMLVRLDATNVQWRRNLALTLSPLGMVRRMRGEIAESRRLLERAREIQQGVLRDSPQRKEWRGDLAEIDVRLAMTLDRAGQDHTAASLARDALAMARENAASPEVAADASLLLGTIAARQGKAAEASERWRSAMQSAGDAATLRLADRRARALLSSGDAAEATPILARLRNAGYANPDLMALAAKKGRFSS